MVLDRLGFIDHDPLPIHLVQQFAVPLQQAVGGQHQVHTLQRFFQGLGAGGAAGSVVLVDRQIRGEGRGFPLPVG